MTQKHREERAVRFIIIGNILATLAGLWAFVATGSQALFLDAFYSGVALLSSVAAYIMAKASKVKTRHYPDGLHFLEPLYAVLKSLLVLVLLIFSAYSVSVEAWDYFVHGKGQPLNIAPIIPYAIAMVIECFFFAFFTYSQNRKMNFTSTILSAESKTCYVDGLQSLGIGIAALAIYFIDMDGKLGFLHYTGDFFITIVLAICSVKEPVRVLKNGFLELTGGTTDDEELDTAVKQVVYKYCENGISVPQVRVVKTGVYITVYLYTDNADVSIVRENILKELNTKYDHIRLVFCQ